MGEKTKQLIADVKLPRMFPVRQTFRRPQIEPERIPIYMKELLLNAPCTDKIKLGMSIAVTAGSRGIANIDVITKCVVDFIKEKKAVPFIVPAMGSHGGATAEGQKEVLHGYGISEESMGCEIRSSMEVARIGMNDEGTDVYIDKHAAQADGIIVVGRVKPHTSFRGPFESGLMKMMTIGLGKQYGAEVCHNAGFRHMAKNIPLFGRAILQNSPVLFAAAILENAFDETARIEIVDADDIETRESELLREAFSYMAKIGVPKCDVLIVDAIGKNFSGNGMDNNVTGTHCTPYVSGGLDAQKVVVLDISEESHGNFMGLGHAAVTTRRAVQKLDLDATYANAVTCKLVEGSSIPVFMDTDREAIQLALKICVNYNEENPKVVRILNSMQLETIWLSEAFLDEITDIPDLEQSGEAEEMAFDKNGRLI
ncbi:DUF2088 domain-containing protein [Clostridium sp. AM58-1XD]|nr:DUF2088 domain-containing protein [Clostridium sp. AM58-1XD]